MGAIRNAAKVRKEAMGKRKMAWRRRILRTGGKSSRHLWSALKPKRQDLSAVEVDGKIFSDKEGVLDQLTKHFSDLANPNSTQGRLHNKTPLTTNSLNTRVYGPTLLDPPITPEETEKAIKLLENRKATGEAYPGQKNVELASPAT